MPNSIAGRSTGSVVSLVLFAIACCLPALEFRNSSAPNDVMFGARALVVGWSGVFAGVMGWYANPVRLAGLVLIAFRKPKLAALAGVVSIAIAASTFSHIGKELPGDEGNVTRTTIIRLLPGFYVWMGALVILHLAALFLPERRSDTLE